MRINNNMLLLKLKNIANIFLFKLTYNPYKIVIQFNVNL